MKDFTEEILARYSKQDPEAQCRNITFQVTEDCCLNCTYCYQGHKTHKMMSEEVAKAGVDLLFSLYDENKEEAVINHHTYGIILDFIGGEPFMNVKIMDYIVNYFIHECMRREHIWLTNFRVSISSNGLLYFQPEVQAFLKKYKKFISLNITIDGPKNLHDACRVDWEGNGSYDRSMAAWEAWAKWTGYAETRTKVTIAPENLHLLEETFDFFIARGCTEIHANPIFEHAWTIEEARKYYDILIGIANKLLENENVHSSLFMYEHYKPALSSDTSNWCGGTGAMLAFDPDGLAFPCLRYMHSSLGDDQPPLVIGDVHGIYNTPKYQTLYKDMCAVTRQSQSSEECIDCPIATGCAYCSAWNYQETGSYNKRSTNICWMHRAEALANVYYWNTYFINNNKTARLPLYLPRSIAKQIITNEEYDFLLLLSQSSI